MIIIQHHHVDNMLKNTHEKEWQDLKWCMMKESTKYTQLRYQMFGLS